MYDDLDFGNALLFVTNNRTKDLGVQFVDLSRIYAPALEEVLMERAAKRLRNPDDAPPWEFSEILVNEMVRRKLVVPDRTLPDRRPNVIALFPPRPIRFVERNGPFRAVATIAEGENWTFYSDSVVGLLSECARLQGGITPFNLYRWSETLNGRMAFCVDPQKSLVELPANPKDGYVWLVGWNAPTDLLSELTERVNCPVFRVERTGKIREEVLSAEPDIPASSPSR